MMYPDIKDGGSVNSCCSTSDNLEYMYGDGVEWEVYSCKECKKQFVVEIEIVRNYQEMLEIE